MNRGEYFDSDFRFVLRIKFQMEYVMTNDQLLGSTARGYLVKMMSSINIGDEKIFLLAKCLMIYLRCLY
jgi:hypothetical protein